MLESMGWKRIYDRIIGLLAHFIQKHDKQLHAYRLPVEVDIAPLSWMSSTLSSLANRRFVTMMLK